MSGVAILQGTTPVGTIGKALYDCFTFANLYRPCAALSARAANSPAANSANRCAGLAAKGLLPATATTRAQQADAALDKLRDYCRLPDSDVLHLSHYRFATNSIVVTYANAFGRFSVADNVCGYSFANTSGTGDVIAQVAASQASIFATGNGVPPTTGVNVVYNDSLGGEAGRACHVSVHGNDRLRARRRRLPPQSGGRAGHPDRGRRSPARRRKRRTASARALRRRS